MVEEGLRCDLFVKLSLAHSGLQQVLPVGGRGSPQREAVWPLNALLPSANHLAT